MGTLFMVCAVVGGTIMLCQFALTLLGITDIDDFDTPEVHMDADVAAHMGHADAAHGHSAHHGQHGAHWLVGVISFRTVVAALTFFGLAGLAANEARFEQSWLPLLIALAAGWAAMYGVHWLMKTLYKMRAEGTARIEYSVGKVGTVYLRVPGKHEGAGKVTLTLQNRTMEYLAVTAGDPIPTGASIVVTRVMGADTVEVEPVQTVESTVHPQVGQVPA